MPTKKQTVWKCDLCNKETVAENVATPKGWAAIEIENPHVDRSWDEKCVCPGCIELVTRALAK